MKIDLYVDFDGVILNSIEVSYQLIRKKYGRKATSEESADFYQNINWNEFLQMCNPINNSIENLQNLIDSGLYNVTVLTHVLSKSEKEAKQKYLKERLPEIKYIAVTKPNPKWESVNCKNAILVDDYSENLELWENHGGTAIKFSQKDKEYKYIKINDLKELEELYPLLKKKQNKTLEKSKK